MFVVPVSGLPQDLVDLGQVIDGVRYLDGGKCRVLDSVVRAAASRAPRDLVPLAAAEGLDAAMLPMVVTIKVMEPRVWTTEEWLIASRDARPSTPDDCTITGDGRRLDTAEKLLAFVEEYVRENPVDGTDGESAG